MPTIIQNKWIEHQHQTNVRNVYKSKIIKILYMYIFIKLKPFFTKHFAHTLSLRVCQKNSFHMHKWNILFRNQNIYQKYKYFRK